MRSYIVILVTAKDKRQARKIVQGLLKERLIACANIIDSVESFFIWQGKEDHSKEALIIIKTQRKLFEKVASKVKLLHSYETPEIIALPIVAGSNDYLGWISKETK